MDDEFDKERLFRERRLLLAVSFVLLAHQWLGITVGKSTDTLGLHFQFDDPSKLWSGVWLVWHWTIVCYIQQFYSLKPWTTYPKERDDEARDRLSDWVSLWRVRRVALRHLRADMPKELRDKRQVRGEGRTVTDPPGSQRQLRTHVSVTTTWSGDDVKLANAKAASLENALVAAGWEVRGGGVSVDCGKVSFCKVASVRIVPVREEPLIEIAARVWTIVWTSFFSDYIAPLIVGVAPVIIALAQTIAASAVHMAHRV